MRRDAAAMAAKSWPDANYQFSRFRNVDSRTRGPGRGRSVTGENVVEDEAKDTAVRRSAQWVAAEIELFGQVGRVDGL